MCSRPFTQNCVTVQNDYNIRILLHCKEKIRVLCVNPKLAKSSQMLSSSEIFAKKQIFTAVKYGVPQESVLGPLLF